MLDGVGAAQPRWPRRRFGDPEINTRIAQYEMAYRMQTSVPDLTDLKGESKSTLDMYGLDDDGNNATDGGYARNCLLARRMAERGVRFVQLMHRGWDQHSDLPHQIRGQCKDVDQPTAALVKDLKARGLLDDTLVIWGGEFGRTVYSQGTLTATSHGRDHHGRCFTDVGGRRRHQARLHPTARPTTTATTSSKTPSTSTTSTRRSSAAWASTTSG